MKNALTKPPLAQSSLNHTPLLPFPPNINQEVHEPGLFQSSNSQLNHHERYFYINKNKISYCLIEPHNFFSTHQIAVANSMHFQFTFTSHLQRLQSGVHLESCQTYLTGPFLEIYLPVEALVYSHGGAPSYMLDSILNATLPNNLFPLVHPWFRLTQHPYFFQ